MMLVVGLTVFLLISCYWRLLGRAEKISNHPPFPTEADELFLAL